MMTASKVDDVSSKSESTICKSVERLELSMSVCQGALLVFIISSRKKTKGRKHFLCFALSLSPHIVVGVFAILGLQCCAFQQQVR